jgi:D-galactose 1-dehydrogenase
VLQVAELERRVAVRGVSLYTAWHSQHAPAVPAMKAWLEGKRMRRIDMTWCEDARRWHPGQRWLWEAGGLGIFDPAINALSILAAATDDPLHLDRAIFHMPANSDTPIAAELSGATAGGAAFTAWTDFRQAGQQTWTLHIETDDGALDMTLGGAELALDGRPQTLASNGEYPPLYFRFAELIRSGKSEVEVRPLMLAADAFLIAQRREVEAFHDDARPPSRP